MKISVARNLNTLVCQWQCIDSLTNLSFSRIKAQPIITGMEVSENELELQRQVVLKSNYH